MASGARRRSGRTRYDELSTRNSNGGIYTHYVPVPEEHHTTLAVDLSLDLVCSVTLHTNEWQRTPDAKAIDEAIGTLMSRAALR